MTKSISTDTQPVQGVGYRYLQHRSTDGLLCHAKQTAQQPLQTPPLRDTSLTLADMYCNGTVTAQNNLPPLTSNKSRTLLCHSLCIDPVFDHSLSLDSVLDLLLHLFNLGFELLRQRLVLHRSLMSQDSSTLDHTDDTKEEVDSSKPVVTMLSVHVLLISFPYFHCDTHK